MRQRVGSKNAAMSDTAANPTLAERAARDAAAGRAPHPAALRPRNRLAVHRADDRAAAGDQHLPADLDDLSLLHQLPRQPPERRGRRDRPAQLRAHPDRHRHLARDAGDGAFRLLDDRARDGARLRPRLSDRPEIPRPRLLDDGHPAPDDAVAGGGRQFLEVPLPAADRALQLHRLVLHRHRPHRRSR